MTIRSLMSFMDIVNNIPKTVHSIYNIQLPVTQ